MNTTKQRKTIKNNRRRNGNERGRFHQKRLLNNQKQISYKGGTVHQNSNV